MKEQVLEVSKAFWTAMEAADEAGMRKYADKDCMFTHFGITAGLDKEIEFYTSGAFQPTKIDFHNKEVHMHGNTAIVLTDCDYALLLDGKETSHHFMVTEVYAEKDKEWKLVQFTFTALVY